jgi:hypothetical protein
MPIVQVPDKAKHYGISKVLPVAVDPASDLVLQYELKLTNGLSCGGAYLKFLTAEESFTPEGLKDNTPYTVMFGPDKCGDTNKVGSTWCQGHQPAAASPVSIAGHAAIPARAPKVLVVQT